MRRISVLIATISLFLSGLAITPANAASYDGTNGTVNCSAGGFFTITSNVVTGNTGCLGEIEIPNTVTSIAGHSFQDVRVNKVTFATPSAVTSIESFAFAGATIASLNFPASVTSIGPYAFGWQWTDAEFVDPVAIPTALTSVTFDAGSTLTTLGRSAFAPNTNLRAITLPSTLTTLGPEVFDGDTSLAEITFLGSEPTLEEIGIPLASNAFRGLPLTAKVNVPWNATGFTPNGEGKWNGLTVVRGQDPAIAIEAARVAAAQASAADLASRTITAKKKYVAKPLATEVGVTIVSSKAKVSISVSRGSKRVCTKSGSKLKTLKAGSCLVTFTVQEPKPKGGKKPKATKTVKTLVVQ
jgi:hypothetical protein